jgi:hypothetical protein
MGRINADERQIPVRLPRMKASHLLEYGKSISPDVFGYRLLDQANQRFLIWVDAGRKPERHGSATVQRVGGVVFEGPPSKSSHERRKIVKVVVRI